MYDNTIFEGVYNCFLSSVNESLHYCTGNMDSTRGCMTSG